MRRISKFLAWLRKPFTPKMMFSESSTFYLIKWFFQRGWRGYSDWDVSEANSYLATVMAGVVQAYVDNHEDWFGGCPYPFYEDDYEGPSWKETCLEIASKLQKGADCLDGTIENTLWYKGIDPIEYNRLTNQAEKEAKKEWEEGMEMLTEHLFGMWV